MSSFEAVQPRRRGFMAACAVRNEWLGGGALAVLLSTYVDAEDKQLAEDLFWSRSL